MRPQKVLIIDDEKDFGLVMKHFFTNRNHLVFVAETIEDGMKLLEIERPDFIFLDNYLPDGLGWSKAEFILSNYPQIQLNLISAEAVPKTSASSFRIFYKPALREELSKMFGK